MPASLRSLYSDTLHVSRLELHMAVGFYDQVWHAWLYDPATDEIVACGTAQLGETLSDLAARLTKDY